MLKRGTESLAKHILPRKLDKSLPMSSSKSFEAHARFCREAVIISNLEECEYALILN